jgi:hypothetical protein
MHVIGLAEKMTDQKLHSAIFDRLYRKAFAETGFEQFSGLQWGALWQLGGQSDHANDITTFHRSDPPFRCLIPRPHRLK